MIIDHATLSEFIYGAVRFEIYQNITVIDTINFVPHFAEFYEDGYLHPNDMGYMKYAECLKEHLC